MEFLISGSLVLGMLIGARGDWTEEQATVRDDESASSTGFDEDSGEKDFRAHCDWWGLIFFEVGKDPDDEAFLQADIIDDQELKEIFLMSPALRSLF